MTFCLFSLAANKIVLHLLIVELIDSLSAGSELDFKANPCLQGFSGMMIPGHVCSSAVMRLPAAITAFIKNMSCYPWFI